MAPCRRWVVRTSDEAVNRIWAPSRGLIPSPNAINSRPLCFPRVSNGSLALGLVDKSLFNRIKGDFWIERKRVPCLYTRLGRGEVGRGYCSLGIAPVGEEIAMVLTQRYHIATAESCNNGPMLALN